MCGLVVIGIFAFEVAFGGVEPAFHRADGQIQPPGDLGLGQFLPKIEVQDLHILVPEVVITFVPGDAEEPGTEGASVPELVKPLEGKEIDLLEHIVGIGLGGQTEPHKTLYRAPLPGKQSFKFLHCVTSSMDMKPVSLL